MNPSAGTLEQQRDYWRSEYEQKVSELADKLQRIAALESELAAAQSKPCPVKIDALEELAALRKNARELSLLLDSACSTASDFPPTMESMRHAAQVVSKELRQAAGGGE